MTNRVGEFLLELDPATPHDGVLRLIVQVISGGLPPHTTDAIAMDDALTIVQRIEIGAEAMASLVTQARSSGDTPEEIIGRVGRRAADTDRVRAAGRAVTGARFEAKHSGVKRFRTLLAEKERGAAPKHLNSSIVRTIKTDGDVAAANEAAIKASLSRLLSDAGQPKALRGIAVLTKEELEEVRARTSNFTESLKLEDFAALRATPGTRPLTIVRFPPHDAVCRNGRLGADPCGGILVNNGSTSSRPDAPAHIPSINAATVASPDESMRVLRDAAVAVAAGTADRPMPSSQDDVQHALDGLALKPGPSDRPSYFEFHQVHIAFEHVWLEAIDEGALDIAGRAFQEVANLTGASEGFLLGIFSDPWREAAFWRGLLADTVAELGETIDPPHGVIQYFEITPEEWGALDTEHREALSSLATDITAASGPPSGPFAGFLAPLMQGIIAGLRERGRTIVAYAARKVESNAGSLSRLHGLVRDLELRLREPYFFTIYAANRYQRSVNFGLVTTYQQEWRPLDYQVGRLVQTIPLAPREVRKFSKKRVVKRARAEKEVANNMESRRSEQSDSWRSESEIVQRAQNKSNFSMTADGAFKLGIADAKTSTVLGTEASSESMQTKKDFREAVLKSAEEYKNERTIEVTSNDATETDADESGEISNPNDELTVTYLFYELQRRYRISERLHRLTPVVLVAQEVPQPQEIDNDWLVAHDWILGRVLLDDSFVPALRYLSTSLVGAEHALVELQRNLVAQRRLLTSLRDDLVMYQRQAGSRYEALEQSIKRRAEVVGGEQTEGILDKAWDFFGGSSGEESEEKARIIEDSAKDAYERAAKEEKSLRDRVEREVTALSALTETYTAKLAEHLNRKEQVSRLRVHVKENILYYMQAVWSHEPPDQRFFRLHTVQVPDLRGTRRVRFNPSVGTVPPSTAAMMLLRPDAMTGVPVEVIEEMEPPAQLTYKSLEEVADLDNLLGYKGNYMIFPLKQSNDLIDYMMRPYFDDVLELRDPDDFGNLTIDELHDLACCLKARDPQRYAKVEPDIERLLREMLTNPRRFSDEVTVPTDSLFIEALPGSHALLETFKLAHRLVDVEKAAADVRRAKLENIRLAARIVAGERSDPDVDKQIVIDGARENVIVPTDI